MIDFYAKILKMTKKDISSGVAHKIPADLRKVLSSDSSALRLWEDITPLARNEWICWVENAKQLETRNRRVARVSKELKEGMRRPCCWYGCIHRTDKPISPSVQNVVLNKKR
jgi:hypothetical protein